MLFNSFGFLFVFLPLAYGAFVLASRSEIARGWTLVGVSLAFYGYWDVRFVPLLVASTVVNWLLAAAFFKSRQRGFLVAAIVIDLLVLGYFKYVNFGLEILRPLFPAMPAEIGVILPLGISFFTFHHIMYLADCYAGRGPFYSFRNYALYIVLFPQILSGPLVRHYEIIPQFPLDPWREGAAERWARGYVLLVIGLAKKVLLADPLGRIADPLFAKAAAGAALSFGDSWTAALAFTFQIYFDFSGYSDMAIGIALLFGYQLPFNFNAPYQATSVREFWRRWHMTLSRFLRDYLYIPLGGNRLGIPRQVYAVMVTFLLGGLWHGAGWSFVIWGGLHGLALMIGVLWHDHGPRLPAPVAWLITFLFVIVAWIFFRAPDLASANAMLAAMSDVSGLASLEISGRALRLILIAAAVSIIGPTSQAVVFERLRPRAWVAVATAAGLIFTLLQLNRGLSYQFIYFQF
jgi:alginate O-acetyltransferase complex protein AlgI